MQEIIENINSNDEKKTYTCQENFKVAFEYTTAFQLYKT